MSARSYTLVAGAAPAADAAAFYSELLSGAAHVVAADAAAEWCVSLGRVPDVAVGDFDSAEEGALERLRARGAEVVAFPIEKDETDLELAVAVARERFGSPVTVTAAFTGRLDHTLAALGLLTRSGRGARASEPGFDGFVVAPDDPLEVAVARGTTFSVLALGGATGVVVRGARWPLDGATLDPLSGLGVSNVTGGEILRVSVRTGTLIVLILTANGRRYTR